MIINRQQVTEQIIASKVRKGLKWSQVADKLELSKEWVTAACLGQMTFNKTQAELIGDIFDLTDEAVAWLQIVHERIVKYTSTNRSLNLSLV